MHFGGKKFTYKLTDTTLTLTIDGQQYPFLAHQRHQTRRQQLPALSASQLTAIQALKKHY